MDPLVRRHTRDCERSQLPAPSSHVRNNRALAAIMPVAPLLLLKKLVLTRIGSTAGEVPVTSRAQAGHGWRGASAARSRRFRRSPPGSTAAGASAPAA